MKQRLPNSTNICRLFSCWVSWYSAEADGRFNDN